MSGAVIEIVPDGLDALNARIQRLLSGLKDPSGLLWDLAQAGENQTRRRLGEDKRAPDGTAWAAWSAAYAQTRHSGQSLLEDTGSLIDSINAFVDGNVAGWGTNLGYAEKHQFGQGGIPARPFLGISASDEQELLDITELWLDRLLAGTA